MSTSLQSWVTEHVSSVLENYLAEHRAHLTSQAPELGELVSTLETFLVGGKYLRPQFVAVGALMMGPETLHSRRASIAQLGAAVELVQAAALIHDDLIDHSDTRRGRPAVHVAAHDAHARAGLAGSSHDFGMATAVVLGDLALMIAEQLAARALTGSDDRAHFDALRTEMIAGQYLDILNQAGGLTSPGSAHAAALSVIRWKTVPYTVERPLLLGASHSNAPAAILRSLSELAVPLGTAFQLRDDLLGVFGDEKTIGKPSSGDITEGKRTTLLAFAEDNASPAQRTALAEAVGHASADEAALSAARRVFEETGARAHVEAEVASLADQTRGLLASSLEPVAHPKGVAELERLITQTTGVVHS